MLNKPKILVINNQYPTPISRKYGLYGGVGYYRQILPARYLPEYTFIHGGKDLLDVTVESMQDVVANMVKGVDLVYTKHLDNPHAVYSLLGACSYYNKPLLVDFDDDVLTTDGLSPDKYSYTGDNDLIHYLTTLLRECTGITVSTLPLIERYRQFNKNIHLAQNMVDISEWKHESRHHERKTVGWCGSASHFKDHAILEDVYPGVIEKNPDVVFSFMGHMLPNHIQGMTRKNWEIKPAIDWWAENPENSMTYPRLLSEQGYDVGLAPITESQFNSSRSLAKWFEYTMTGIPMVASEWGPYLDLTDGQEAYLVKTKDGWVDAINNLIQNPNDGQRLVTNARKLITDKYSTTALIHEWREVCERYIGHGFAK